MEAGLFGAAAVHKTLCTRLPHAASALMRVTGTPAIGELVHQDDAIELAVKHRAQRLVAIMCPCVSRNTAPLSPPTASIYAYGMQCCPSSLQSCDSDVRQHA